MVNDYWRISYKGIGIYEALKKEIWNTSDFPKKEWENFKKSKAVVWLKTPNTYSKNNYSYFTELGYNLFMKNTYPIIVKYLNENNILREKFTFDTIKMNIVYSDEHQIVIEKESDKNGTKLNKKQYQME